MKDPYDSIEGVSRRTGLASDYANAWMPLVQKCINAVDLSMAEGIERVDPRFRILTYEAYIAGRGGDDSYNAAVVRVSDPDKVRCINEAIHEMNALLPELLKGKSYQAVIDFWEKRVQKLLS